MIFRRPHPEKEEISTDRYLITYSDLITLLLGLFVILYATSHIDEEKYKRFSEAFSEYFNAKANVKPENNGNGLFKGSRNGIPEPILPPSNKQLTEIEQETREKFKGLIEQNLFSVGMSNGSLVIKLPETLLFNSGKADIQQTGKVLLDSLTKVLGGIPYLITVDGHTDSDPITTRYESNWHLSNARALNVGYAMVKSGLPESNLCIRGFGSQRPIAENTTESGKQQNRRVEITISPLPAEAPSDVGYSKEDSIKKN